MYEEVMMFRSKVRSIVIPQIQGDDLALVFFERVQISQELGVGINVAVIHSITSSTSSVSMTVPPLSRSTTQ